MATNETHDDDDDDRWRHEDGCDLRSWTAKSSEPKPECRCLGIDYSELLLDGDDCYD